MPDWLESRGERNQVDFLESCKPMCFNALQTTGLKILRKQHGNLLV